jgi:hypothetical protein
MEIPRVSRQPTRIEFFEHESKEIELLEKEAYSMIGETTGGI